MSRNNESKKMAAASIVVSIGVTAVIFSTQFFELKPNMLYAILLLVAGLAGIIYGLVRWPQ
jgi:hypothetical protein